MFSTRQHFNYEMEMDVMKMARSTKHGEQLAYKDGDMSDDNFKAELERSSRSATQVLC